MKESNENTISMEYIHQEMQHLINSIPGGIASYRVEGKRFIPDYFSDGVLSLSGHSREEFEELVQYNALDIIYEQDRDRVLEAAKKVLISGEVLSVSYRMRHKNGNLIWIHLNGRRMGPMSESCRFYAVFTGMSEESRLFRNIANQTADGIYIIDRKNYDLLYANESKHLFMKGTSCIGKKCYEELHGKNEPCEFCILQNNQPDGQEHEVSSGATDMFYGIRFRETDWKGIPAYILYVRDISEEINNRREKERLEQYFQNLVKNLPGGVAVVRYEKDGSMVPEYMSEGFAAMTGMTLDEAWELYGDNATAGIHPDDLDNVRQQMDICISNGQSHWNMIYRIKKGRDDYIWVKNNLSLIHSEGGESRVYAVYHEMTRELEEQKQLRKRYKEMIIQHYSAPDPHALIIGHCNITQNHILEIMDTTDSNLLERFGTVRDEFFTGLANIVVEENEKQKFLDTYLNAPSLEAFKRNETELIQKCFVLLPRDVKGRYVQFKVNLVEAPDTGDITGILTVTDITDQTISDLILRQLSVTNYDFIIDLNLELDSYVVLAHNNCNHDIPHCGCHSSRTAHMAQSAIFQKDRDKYLSGLDSAAMLRRLETEGTYTFSYSLTDRNGDVRIKNMTISAVDLRIGRVCMVRTDITDSVREQQGMLNMIAYTFDLACFINLANGHLVMYTREIVLKNQSPYFIENYNEAVGHFSKLYGLTEGNDEIMDQFHLNTILGRLSEKPKGYDFVVPFRMDNEISYKQINVLWGDENQRTVCMVRADVTDMLMSERSAKRKLEEALEMAEKASRAKGDFLSAMSHDIRTPMNAIMGMTALASAHLDDRDRVEDCLKKISASSRYLLSLINDILDMSKIEQSKLTLNLIKASLPQLLEQISDMIMPQAWEAGLQFVIRTKGICHEYFYGDLLHINQILINLLSNAVKFTPENGTVELLVEETPSVNRADRICYHFTVSDTGSGIQKEFLEHIFEPFARSRSASFTQGTGLGLSITKGLVDLMEGRISVESQVGIGTVFHVELEFEPAKGERRTVPKEVHQSTVNMGEKDVLSGCLFLVAEDNEINAEIICEVLRMYGAESVVKTNGVQAVNAFESALPGTYAAILMDVQMPEMNGYDATRIIREMERADARKIPIIAMTANAFAEDIQAALDAGMTAHVAKPIDLDILRRTLSDAIYGNIPD